MADKTVDARLEVQCLGFPGAVGAIMATLQGIPPDPCGWFGSKHVLYGVPYCPICGGSVGEERKVAVP